MADSKLNFFMSSGTAAERAAFTPDPPTPAAGMAYTYLWMEEDTNKAYVWDNAGAAWIELAAAGGAPAAHATQHQSGGSDPIALDTLAAPTDITTLNASTTAHGLLIKAVAPAASLMNVPGIVNGETVWTNKPLFDATNPADLGTAAPGTSVIAAHRDHVHLLPTPTTVLDPASSTQGAMVYRGAASWDALAAGTAGYRLRAGGAAANPSWVADSYTVNFVMDGGGSVIATGVKGYVEIPVAGVITAVRLFADQATNFEMDIYEDVYANYPPDSGDSIVDVTPPTITSPAVKSEDTTLTDWLTTLVAGSILGFEVVTNSAAELVTLSITIRKTN